MEFLTNPEVWMAFLTLTLLEIVLGIDNIIFISVLTARLPEADRPRGRYVGLTLAMVWILQLFPASAKLAPIYHPVTRMVPPTFPLLLVVPAVLFDLILRRHAGRPDWQLALVMGPLFMVALLAVQWPFAEFLLSPAARNPFFASDLWDYNYRPGAWQYEYWHLDRGAGGAWSAAKFWSGIAFAAAIATVSSWIGLVRGRWMKAVQR